jgi:hypothetical protein
MYHFPIQMLFCLPFYGFPPIVSIILSVHSKISTSQIFLGATSLIYGVWFAFMMYFAFYVERCYWAIVVTFFFFCFYALPVLLPLWIAANIIEKRHRKKQAEP